MNKSVNLEILPKNDGPNNNKYDKGYTSFGGSIPIPIDSDIYSPGRNSTILNDLYKNLDDMPISEDSISYQKSGDTEKIKSYYSNSNVNEKNIDNIIEKSKEKLNVLPLIKINKNVNKKMPDVNTILDKLQKYVLL